MQILPQADEGPEPLPGLPCVAVRGLSFTYPSGQTALHDVGFELQPGERVAVVGPNGAGKTTLLLHLNGLLPEPFPTPRAGRPASVVVAGLDVVPSNFREIRRRVGLLFQDPDDQLFCPTVGEDVAFGPLNLGLPLDEVRRRVRDALAQVGLEGYENRRTTQLSVGERKRACLAGLFVCRPDLLILDEPTSNLDPRARRQLLGILQQHPAAQLVATHDLEFVVELCSRVLVIDEGRIHADGSVRSVLGNARLLERHGLEVPLSLISTRSAARTPVADSA